MNKSAETKSSKSKSIESDVWVPRESCHDPGSSRTKQLEDVFASDSATNELVLAMLDETDGHIVTVQIMWDALRMNKTYLEKLVNSRLDYKFHYYDDIDRELLSKLCLGIEIAYAIPQRYKENWFCVNTRAIYDVYVLVNDNWDRLCVYRDFANAVRQHAVTLLSQIYHAYATEEQTTPISDASVNAQMIRPSKNLVVQLLKMSTLLSNAHDNQPDPTNDICVKYEADLAKERDTKERDTTNEKNEKIKVILSAFKDSIQCTCNWDEWLDTHTIDEIKTIASEWVRIYSV